MKCSRPALKPLAKVWYHFIRTRLLPTTYIKIVNKERLVLLYCILEGKKLNIGQLIQREIYTCAFKPNGGLFFPSLITELCLRSGLEISSSDEMLANTGAINTAAIKRFALPSTKLVPSQVPHSEQTRGTGELATKVQHLTELFQRHIQQQ